MSGRQAADILNHAIAIFKGAIVLAGRKAAIPVEHIRAELAEKRLNLLRTVARSFILDNLIILLEVFLQFPGRNIELLSHDPIFRLEIGLAVIDDLLAGDLFLSDLNGR